MGKDFKKYVNFYLLINKILKEKEPENPVVYLTKIVKKLDVKNRNGIVALIVINLSVILLFKFYLKGSGLLSWLKIKVEVYLLCFFKLLGYSKCFSYY